MLPKPVHFASVCLLASASVAQADFMPENDLWREDGLLRGATVTEVKFNEVIDLAETIYSPIIAENFGAVLKINRYWEDARVNANARQTGTSWEVNLFGGLARRPEVTADGFALVLCHEIGHHLGGYPYGLPWGANEGASDYYATIACPRLIWKDQTAVNASFRRTVEKIPKAACDKAWKTSEDQELCYRVTTGGKSMADLLSSLDMTQASWSTPDTTVLTYTYDRHPLSQCRLDTYLAGAVCTKNFDEAVIPGKSLGNLKNSKASEQEALKYSCSSHEKYTFGFRPTCWFKPQI